MFFSALLFLPFLATPVTPATQSPVGKKAPITNSNPSTKGMSEIIHRGGAFTLTKTVTLDDIMAKVESYGDKPVRINGKVKAVCLKKGCWLVLAGQAPTSRARVTFKDYAFFAPMDSQGYAASVEGVLKVKILSEGERAHLAEDGKVSIDEVPKAELRIVASAAAFQKTANTP